ncbi:MAG TPA: tripartite tricarboxylate transporter substrate binding protein [Xanthobacteraceae bacterium]|jgi:tripartite-type tricarboxylate transporter receptor subunit TctC
MKRLHLLLSVVCGIALAAMQAPVHAQAQDKYPSKPVKILVPYGPGGATDIVARIVGEHLRDVLGQAFYVENKPGGYGMIAIEDMARSKPDGYTLMVGNVSTNAITPILFKSKLKISYERDVIPVMRLVDVPAFLLVTTTNFAPRTVGELIDNIKKNPGRVRYGTVGVGSYPDYDMALFAKRAGNLELTGIPNRAGAAGVVLDMIMGDTQTAFLNVASTAAMVKSGKLKALAIVNHERLPEFPDVPTMQEVGFPDVGTIAWQAMFAPAGTPKEILEVLQKAAIQAMQVPAAKRVFAEQNFNIVPTRSVDEAKPWLAQEMTTWSRITQEVKIEVPE